ncbi:unnamed protein product [Camellia sinensis]
MRKQKHVNDLMAELGRLREENSCVFTRVTGMTQLCMNFEAENSVLRAQVAELTHRLDSLNEIMECLSSNNNNGVFEGSYDRMINDGDDFLNPWNLLYVNQPIMFLEAFQCLVSSLQRPRSLSRESCREMMKEAKSLLQCCRDNDVNFFDNAEVDANGRAEEIMGQAIRELGWKRSDIVVSTKICWGGSGPNDKGLYREHIIEGTKASLKRLEMRWTMWM